MTALLEAGFKGEVGDGEAAVTAADSLFVAIFLDRRLRFAKTEKTVVLQGFQLEKAFN